MMKRHTKILTTALAALFAFASIPALSAQRPEAMVTANAATYNPTSPTGYTKASDVDYVTNNGYTVNWGARGEDCTFLSSKAIAFYTGSNTYEVFSQKSGSTSTSSVPSSDLYKALKSFMKSKHSNETSYNATRSLYKYTDCVLNGYNVGISSFYSGDKIGPDWDSGSTWNREHTWPDSKGLGGNDENDIMMLRPTSTSENSSRGNTAYGESSSYYDPNKESDGALNLHGDCARIVLYVYTRWGNTSYMWGASGVMENLTVLLKWMKEDPVDTWEMGRNDAVQSITGTRNVFIDYPELAWKLFGQSIPTNMNTPSGIASGGVIIPPDDSDSSGSSSSSSDIILPPISSDSSTGSSTVDPTPDDPTPDTPLPSGTLAAFDFGAKSSASHQDGKDATSKTYTENDYNLNIKNGVKLYVDAFDAKGNSCLKLGSSSAKGSFSFTVPDDVTSVAIYAAQYKSDSATLTINGKQHTLTTASNNGEYEAYVVDTTTTKTVTVESNKRAMIDKILFLGADDTPPDDSTPDSETSSGGSVDSSVDPTPDDSTSNDSTPDTPSTDSSIPGTSSDGSADSSIDPTPDDSTSDDSTPNDSMPDDSTSDVPSTDNDSSSTDSDSIPTDGEDTDSGLLGCSSFIGASTLSMMLLAGCVMLLKKKEN